MCLTAEDYHGYDRELGLCVCREPPGRAACGGLCKRKPATHLKLWCRYDQDMALTWSYESQVTIDLHQYQLNVPNDKMLSYILSFQWFSSIVTLRFISFSIETNIIDIVRKTCSDNAFMHAMSPSLWRLQLYLMCCTDLLIVNTVIVCLQVSSVSGSVLETVFERWDPQGTLQCHSHHKSSRPVYIVQTTGGDALSNNRRQMYNRVFFSLRQLISLWFPVTLMTSFFFFICIMTAEAGFFGLLSGLPEEIQQLFPDTTQSSAGLSLLYMPYPI